MDIITCTLSTSCGNINFKETHCAFHNVKSTSFEIILLLKHTQNEIRNRIFFITWWSMYVI